MSVHSVFVVVFCLVVVVASSAESIPNGILSSRKLKASRDPVAQSMVERANQERSRFWGIPLPWRGELEAVPTPSETELTPEDRARIFEDVETGVQHQLHLPLPSPTPPVQPAPEPEPVLSPISPVQPAPEPVLSPISPVQPAPEPVLSPISPVQPAPEPESVPSQAPIVEPAPEPELEPESEPEMSLEPQAPDQDEVAPEEPPVEPVSEPETEPRGPPVVKPLSVPVAPPQDERDAPPSLPEHNKHSRHISHSVKVVSWTLAGICISLVAIGNLLGIYFSYVRPRYHGYSAL